MKLTVEQVIFQDNTKENLDYLSLLFLNIRHLKSIILNNIINSKEHQCQSLDLIPTIRQKIHRNTVVFHLYLENRIKKL